MNKAQLIDVIAEQADLSKAAAGRMVDSFVDTIVKAVAKNVPVTLVGFGTFKQSKRAARSGRNPRTGEELKIPAALAPRFSPGTEFKKTVNADGAKKSAPKKK